MNLEKSLFKGIRNTIAAVAMVSIFTACPHPTQPTPQETKPQIANTAIVLPDYNSQKISSATPNSITLSQKIDSLSPGKIIISDITPSTPQGLLRKVVDVSSDGKTLITEDASLEEVVDNYSFSSTQELTSSNIRSVILSKGITPRSSLDLFNFNYDLKNVVLYDIDGNLQTTDDQINANGNISFNSKFDLEFKIENFEMKNLTFKNITTDNVNVTINSPKEFLDMHKTYKIIHHDFKPFVIGTIPTIPPIPIIVTPKLDVDLDVYVKSSSLITATLTQNADLTLGVSYSDNSWAPISVFNNNFNFQKPTLPDEVNISVVPSQELSLWLYDRAAGLYGKLSEYADFSSYKTDKIRWQIYGGLFGDIGIDMGIFKKFIPSYSKRVLQYDKLIDSGEIPINGGSGGNGGSTGDITNKILFVSDRDGNSEIFVMNSDGSNPINLTNNPSANESPKWNSQRNKIVFVSNRENSAGQWDSRYEIWSMNSDGTNPTRLTNNSFYDHNPCWSPDGKKIVFVSGRDKATTNLDYQLYIMNSDGSNPTKLSSDNFSAEEPSFSPDGTKIVYSGYNGVYTINLSDKIRKKLNLDNVNVYDPSWSSFWEKILFTSREDNQIYVMDTNGLNKHKIISSPGMNFWPIWSKDESKILFSSTRDGNWEVYSVYYDGHGLTNLTNNSFADEAPN